jgi:hypothetical protein
MTAVSRGTPNGDVNELQGALSSPAARARMVLPSSSSKQLDADSVAAASSAQEQVRERLHFKVIWKDVLEDLVRKVGVDGGTYTRVSGVAGS